MAERDDIREEIKDKLAAAEARTDAKIAELSGKIDLVLNKIDGISGRFGEIRTDVGARMGEIRSDIRDDGRSTRANYWLGIAAIVAIIVALYAAFPAVVDFGMKIGEIKAGQETSKSKTP